MEPQPHKPSKRGNENLAKYSTMGFKMAVVIFGGVYGGYRLDKWIGWKFPVCTLVLALTSLSLAIYIMIRDLQK